MKALLKKRKQNKEIKHQHETGDNRELTAVIFSCFAAISVVIMLVLRIRQLYLGIPAIFKYASGESFLVVLIAIARQLLRLLCVFYGLNVVWLTIQVFFVKKEKWESEKHIRIMKWSYRLTFLGMVLFFVSLGDSLTSYLMIICIFCQMIMSILLSNKIFGRIIMILITTVYTLFVGAILIYSVFYCRSHELPTNKVGVSLKATENKFNISQLWEMSNNTEFYHAAVYKESRSNNYGLTVIPGMDYTTTLNTESKKIDTCTSMTPQGIAVSKKYIFISAYCHSKQHKSVIYMINKKKNSFEKLIVLPDTSHAGGLAYDSQNDVLWVSSKINIDTNGEKKRFAAASCMTLEQLENYDFDETGKPITYMNTCKTMFAATSFMTYHNGYLYTGYWLSNKSGMSMVGRFKIGQNGTSINEVVDEISYIPGQVQGMVVEDNKIWFSISYGVDDSALAVFENGEGVMNFTYNKAVKTVVTPQKLEQIYSYGGQLYSLFESASFAYRLTAPICMDHVVTLNKNFITSGLFHGNGDIDFNKEENTTEEEESEETDITTGSLDEDESEDVSEEDNDDFIY